MYSKEQRKRIELGLHLIKKVRHESADYDDDERDSDTAIEVLEPVVARAATVPIVSQKVTGSYGPKDTRFND